MLGLIYWIVTVIIANIPGVPPVFRQIALVVLLVILLIVVLEELLPFAGYRGVY